MMLLPSGTFLRWIYSLEQIQPGTLSNVKNLLILKQWHLKIQLMFMVCICKGCLQKNLLKLLSVRLTSLHTFYIYNTWTFFFFKPAEHHKKSVSNLGRASITCEKLQPRDQVTMEGRKLMMPAAAREFV